MIRLVITLACLLAALPLAAQTRGSVHAEENTRLGYGELRGGANGNDPAAPNYANFDEERVGDLAIPPLIANTRDTTPDGWKEQRAQIAQLVEDEWVGRIPPAAASLRLAWARKPAEPVDGAVAEHWVATITAPDGRTGPTIDATLTLPIGAQNVPVLVEYTYIWPPGFTLPGPPRPSLRDAALARGWGHVAYRPTLLQADDTAKLPEGVIGLTGWPRAERDWGALRAWGWGASRLREVLADDARIAGDRIALAGHSRFGKAVLVAAAFDHAFANALVSSSGAGGAKLMRRDFGERLENMADAYASVWYAARIKHYAGRAALAEWPVDAHMLIALRAPHPLFISTGLTEKGDGWTDPTGQRIATDLARPAWAIDAASQPVRLGSDTRLTFSQHAEGHEMWPAFDAFLSHAEAQFD